MVWAERETFVVLEKSNVAVSAVPRGTVIGFQLAAVFQSPELGFALHVALPANVLLAVESRSNSIATVTNKNGDRRCGCGEGAASSIDEDRSMVFFIILFFR
jgi:hypothetical protein